MPSVPAAGHRRRKVQPPSESSSTSTAICSKEEKNLAIINALQHMSPNDEWSIFGEHIASELRALSLDRAQNLKRKILLDTLNETERAQVNSKKQFEFTCFNYFRFISS